MTTINKFDSDLKPRVKEDTGGILPGIRVDRLTIDSFSLIPDWDQEKFKELRLRLIGGR